MHQYQCCFDICNTDFIMTTTHFENLVSTKMTSSHFANVLFVITLLGRIGLGQVSMCT